MSKYSIKDRDLEEIIDELIENDYCPFGKQVTGCPLDNNGEVPTCETCWDNYFFSKGVK